MRSCKSSFVTAAAIASFRAAADTIRVSWTTDPDHLDDFPAGAFGPDGPWQAVAVFVGDDGSDDERPGVPVPLWPSTFDVSVIPTVELGGNYSAKDSDSAVSIKGSRGDLIHDIEFNGQKYFDSITLPRQADGTSARTNGSLLAATEYKQAFPALSDSESLNQTVGMLGLSTNVYRRLPGKEPEVYPSILEQLKEDGKIGTTSYSVHVGSVELEQPGSFILGGYEQNRVIGRAGVFPLPGNPIDYHGNPLMPLIDVALGVETGGSPFSRPGPISVYSGLGDNGVSDKAGDTARQLGSPPGAAIVYPDPAVPYIYLPSGTCQEAAKHLPVHHESAIGLYLWNTSDPRYDDIVNSPAYMAFTFVDRTDTNVTIKVPFRLLDLTLTAPIVDETASYFPCKTGESIYGFWALGRAFLQGAVLAVDYDANVTYLAQAAGPGMGASVIKEMEGDGDALEGIEDGLEASWKDHWNVLPGGDNGGGGGLSGGAIAGIVVGVVVLLGAIATAVILLKRKRQTKTVGGHDEKPWAPRLWVSWWKGAEMQGTPVQELDVPNGPHEAPGKRLAHEMPGQSIPAELPASPIEKR